MTLDARPKNRPGRAEGKRGGGPAGETHGSQCTGSVVVLDVKDFSILCAQSYPNYDLTKYMDDPQYREDVLLNKDGTYPMFNRCFEGEYPIGSTMKPAVALAALQEGIINTSTQFRCGHTYYNEDMPTFHPQCMGTHGFLNVTRALTVSCNIFFLRHRLRPWGSTT